MLNLKRQQETLSQVIESINSELELRPLLTGIVFHACQLLDADNGTIGLVDEEKKVVRTEAAYRMPSNELGAEIPSGVGLFGEVYARRKPVIYSRYGDVESPTQQNMLEMAVIGVPIFWRDRLIGVFGLGSPSPRRFTDLDVEVLSSFGKHAAIAIENARLFDGAQRSLSELRMLYETSQRIATAMSLDDVVRAYLEQVAAQGRQYVCSVVLYQNDSEGRKRMVEMVGRWSLQEGITLPHIHYPYTYDALDPPLDAGKTILIENVHTDPRVSQRLREIQVESGRPALAMVPLMVHGERIGLVILSHTEPQVMPEELLRPYQITAAQLSSAIASRLQHERLASQERRVAILEERQRLARDLHDSVTQLLFSITLIAQSIRPAWERSNSDGEERIERLLEVSRRATLEMRALLAELRPTVQTETTPSALTETGIGLLRHHGLIAALEQHCLELRHEGSNIVLDTNSYTPLSQECEEAIFRIFQEALNNVVKHAKAKNINLLLRQDENNVYLSVVDDGIGFDTPCLGFGLTTMRERAEVLGGKFKIWSQRGKGTHVEAVLPVAW